MNVQRENISDSRVKLTITVDANELQNAEQVALTKLAREIKAPGFRKGKVPVSVAAKYVDPQQLATETADNAMSKAVAEAFLGAELQALNRPEVEVLEFEPGKSMKFTAEADVLPPVTLGNYKKLKVPKQEKVSIGKKEIDDVTDRIRTQLAEKKTVERAAKEGDVVVLNFVGKKDGEAFDGGSAENYELTLGSNTFIPGFEEGVVGMKAGDEKNLELTFPKDYQMKQLAGQKVVFEVKINQVQSLEKPELTDELAAKVGPYTTAKELTDDIKRELTTQAESKQQEEVRNSLVDQVVEKSKVSVPEILRDDQIRSIEQDLRQNLMYRGQSIDQYYEQQGFKDRDEWLKAEGNNVAEQRVKTGLVIAELSKVEKIEASTAELAERTQALKQQYSSQPDMAKRLDEPDSQRSIANQVITEKTIDRLVELNK